MTPSDFEIIAKLYLSFHDMYIFTLYEDGQVQVSRVMKVWLNFVKCGMCVKELTTKMTADR